MRLTTPIKVATLVFLAIGTSMVTSALLGQNRPPRGNQASARKAVRVARANNDTQPQGSVSATPLNNNGPAERDMQLMQGDQGEAEESVASFRMRSMNASVDGNTVTVAASGYLRDSRPDVAYFWSLRVLDISDTPQIVSRNHYLKQSFGAPKNFFNVPLGFDVIPKFEANPDFAETLQLPPGKYRIEVVLSAVPTKFDTKTLGDEQVLRSIRVIGDAKDVTISPVSN